ncbi:MAG: hypothetical protein ABIA62_07805 [Candidatus Woesearchaeota archaeon]
MRIDQCPKRLNNCPERGCPEYPCWAYEKHLDNKDRNSKKQDSGWE